MNGTVRHRKGFTLAELLVVVAIIAVLVAIAVPTYRAATAKAEASACLANRAMLFRQLRIWEMGNGDFSNSTELQSYIASAKGAYTCPGDGTIDISVSKEGKISVKCSVHGSASSADDGSFLGSSYPLNTSLPNAISGLAATINTSSVDSTASKGAAITALKDTDAYKALPLDENGIVSWRYQKTGTNPDGSAQYQLYWSAVDISTLKPGATVPVLKYDSKLNCYSVWDATIRLNSINGESYNIFNNFSELADSQAVSATDKQTLTNVSGLYDAALETYYQNNPQQ